MLFKVVWTGMRICQVMVGSMVTRPGPKMDYTYPISIPLQWAYRAKFIYEFTRNDRYLYRFLFGFESILLFIYDFGLRACPNPSNIDF